MCLGRLWHGHRTAITMTCRVFDTTARGTPCLLSTWPRLRTKHWSKFCKDFVEHPYRCYTEHGLHALFYTKLYNALPEPALYRDVGGREMCVIQKEYPTHDSIGRSRRQHWDIAVIKTPVVLPETCKGLTTISAWLPWSSSA